MKYAMLVAKTTDDLDYKVNELTAKSYIMYGAPFGIVSEGISGYKIFQAMIKHEVNQEPLPERTGSFTG